MKLKPIRLMKDKRGQSIIDAVIFVVIAFIIIIFFAYWRYGFGVITNSLLTVVTPANSLNLNVSAEAAKTFGNINNGMNNLKLVGFCMIFGMILTILISNFLIKSHPVFFVGYLLVGIIAVIFSMVISNAYSSILNTPNDSTALLIDDAVGTFIMAYLPIWVAVITFIGAIFLFSGINRDEQSGGGLQ